MIFCQKKKKIAILKKKMKMAKVSFNLKTLKIVTSEFIPLYFRIWVYGYTKSIQFYAVLNSDRPIMIQRIKSRVVAFYYI
jgi:hypothetical protein